MAFYYMDAGELTQARLSMLAQVLLPTKSSLQSYAQYLFDKGLFHVKTTDMHINLIKINTG